MLPMSPAVVMSIYASVHSMSVTQDRLLNDVIKAILLSKYDNLL